MQSEPHCARTMVWALSISLAATLEIDVSFSSSPYLDVSVQEVPPVNLWIQLTVHEGFSCGFPHSDICGSMDICSSPQLFAAYHVFLRLLVPRHPPCALNAWPLSIWMYSVTFFFGLLIILLNNPRMSWYFQDSISVFSFQGTFHKVSFCISTKAMSPIYVDTHRCLYVTFVMRFKDLRSFSSRILFEYPLRLL